MEVQLLIVDDEMQIRRGIELGIPWKDFGITRVLTAEDSPGAITILEREKIQILITDIRMPGMTGLDLAEFSKKMNPDIHVIILSGYSEFDYAKKAINIGVVEYLIKPIKINELTGLIQKIMEEIQSRIQEDAQQRKGMLEQRLKACFDGAGESDENYERLLEEYTGCELNKNILCIVFGFDSRISNDISRSCEYAREQLINEEKNGKENTYLLSWGKKLVWFTLMDIRRSRDQVIFQMGNVLRRINGDLRKTDSCGISGGAAGIMPLKNLHLAVKAGEQLLNHRLYLGCSVLIDQKDVRKKSETMFTLGETGHLRLCIAGYRYAGAEKYIKKQFRNMSELKITSYDIVKGTCLNLMQILFHTLKSSGLDVEAVLEKNRQSNW